MWISRKEKVRGRVGHTPTARVHLLGERSIHMTLLSCPASVFRGVQPGWAHTLAVLSYEEVRMKSPVPPDDGEGEEGKRR